MRTKRPASVNRRASLYRVSVGCGGFQRQQLGRDIGRHRSGRRRHVGKRGQQLRRHDQLHHDGLGIRAVDTRDRENQTPVRPHVIDARNGVNKIIRRLVDKVRRQTALPMIAGKSRIRFSTR